MKNRYVIMFYENELKPVILLSSKREQIMELYSLMFEQNSSNDILQRFSFKEIKEMFRDKNVKVLNLDNEDDYMCYSTYLSFYGFNNTKPEHISVYLKNRGL